MTIWGNQFWLIDQYLVNLTISDRAIEAIDRFTKIVNYFNSLPELNTEQQGHLAEAQ